MTRWRITTRMDDSKDFCDDEVMIMLRRRRNGKKKKKKNLEFRFELEIMYFSVKMTRTKN